MFDRVDKTLLAIAICGGLLIYVGAYILYLAGGGECPSPF